MMVTLFFGGWTLPLLGLDQPAATLLGWASLHIAIFLAKVCCVPAGVHLGALDVAALPVRPVDGFGLAAVFAAGAGEHCGDGGRAVESARSWDER